MDNSNRQMFPFDDALHVHQAGTVRPDNVFGSGSHMVFHLVRPMQTDTACSSTANIPPKPQHSSIWLGSKTSIPSTRFSKSRNLL